MATELSNQVIARDVSDGQIVEGLAVASSIRQTYRTADLTALQAITGQVTGDFGYTIDNGYTYQWTGTAWAPVLYDTGELNMSSVGVWGPGWSGGQFGDIKPAYVRLKNGIVYLVGAFSKNTSWVSGDVMFTFTDSRFIPKSLFDVPGKITPNSFANVGVRPDGKIVANVANGSSGTYIHNASSWLV